MKKTLKLTACVLALVLTLSLLPLPQLHAVELNDLPQPTDAVLALYTDGTAKLTFSSNLGSYRQLADDEQLGYKVQLWHSGKVFNHVEASYSEPGAETTTQKILLAEAEALAGGISASVCNVLYRDGQIVFESSWSTLSPAVSLPTTIDTVTVLPANVEFFAGEAPNAIGRVQNDVRVSPVYESWASWGKDGSLDLWSSHPYGSKTFTAFKEGVTYDYNIALEAAEGYVFADDVNLTVAGLSPAADCLVDKSSPNKRIYSRFYTFTCEKAPTLKDFEINGATLSLKAGKPESESAVFTGKVPDGAGYTVEEYWSIEEDGTTKFYTSNAATNRSMAENSLLIDSFEVGKTYRYGLIFVPGAIPADTDASAYTLIMDGKRVNVPGTYERDKTACFFPAATCTAQNIVTDFAVENATLSLQPGPAPIDDPGKLFTGKAPDGAAYALEWELWYCVEDHTSFTSSRPGNEERRALNMLLTSFEPGKTYVYYVRLALRDGEGIHLPANQRDIRLTLNGQLVDKRYVTMDSYNKWVYGNEPVTITLPAQSGGGSTSFIEPDYYPDDSENEDVAPAAAPAPATPGRDESDTAPKTADAPILPTLLLAAFAALALTVSAKKRLCK